MTDLQYKRIVWIAFIILCLCGFIYSSYEIIMWNFNVEENSKINDKLNEKVTVTKKDNKYEIDFKSLKEINSDTIGYVKVKNTNIDYVVVKGTDNEYYLKHNFEKKWNIAGWIFGDYHNKFDGSDRHLIIYGHNTKDGSMFGTLTNILEADWYKNTHNHKVLLVTENGTYQYQVFSTYSIVPEDYYINTQFKNDSDFAEFIKVLKSRSIYDYGVDVSEKDKILTLSSCIGDGEKRVVLHAKLIENK